MRISPPNNSGFSLRSIGLPKWVPRYIPATDSMKADNPMTKSGWASVAMCLKPMHANDIPMAKASILVATANISCVFNVCVSFGREERIPNHSASQESQQTEGNPMVHLF